MIALTFARRGLHAHATASLLAFECYLRVGEHLRLRYQDVAMPNDPRLGSAHTKMCLRLVRTKTGMNKWATIRCPVVAAAMQLYLSSRTFAPDDLIFPFSMYQWRTQLRSITVDLGLGHIPFVPHSFCASFLSAWWCHARCHAWLESRRDSPARQMEISDLV